MTEHKLPILDSGNKIPTLKLGGSGATVDTFLRGDQTWAIPCDILVRKSSDQNVTGVTFADCSGLSFSGEINSEYLLEFQLVYSTSAPAIGINLGLNGPTGSAVSYLYRVSSAVNAEQARFGNTLDNAMNTTTASASTALNMALMNVWIKTGETSGTIVLRFAAETAAGSIIIKAGSIMKYRKIV